MPKITPKNLTYDLTLPPFLQRMQAANTSLDGRNEFQSARPKKPRDPDNEAEDEPVFFNEETGETLTKKDWEEKEKAKEEAEEAGREDGKVDSGVGKERKEEKEKLEKRAGFGVSRKRKTGKVVSVDEDEEKRDVVGEPKRENSEKGKGNKVEKGRSAKKRKKIKLSFGDDE